MFSEIAVIYRIKLFLDNHMKDFYKNGLCFSCTNCSKCCRFEGGAVLLSKEDLTRLAKWANLTEEQFEKAYCRWLEGSDGLKYLCLREKSNCDCIFWDSRINGCEAYEARPEQCRTYPFWSKILESEENWNAEKNSCPAIGTGQLITPSEIKKQLESYQRRIPITK